MKPSGHRVMFTRRSFIVAAALGSLATALPAGSQQPIVIKFSHVVAEDTPKGRAAAYFKKLAEQRTKGRVRIDVYPNSKLYKDSDEIAALQRGDVQMLAPSLAKFHSLGVREFEVFDLPYLFGSYADVHRVTMGQIGRDLLAKLETKGISGLAYWDNGFKQMSANKPLRHPDDVNGLRMRIQPSLALEAEMRALGAKPVVMDFSETYAALKSGQVDGTENPASNFVTQNMQEVQKHMAVTYHGYLGYAVIANHAVWRGLPDDIRRALADALREATIFANDVASEANNDALAEIERSGKTQVARLSPHERDEWKRRLIGVHREMEATVGKELIEAIYKQTDFVPPKP